ncbi:GntR family transcriptional regulator [Galactobacter valiniphilus]|uniref:GntR family transcriptional regulator n=1 Tax=Galactobacter valiniphilus TaxID=2676122 RepID=A0A399JCP3_9MICC|nr:GntR family transcriptional regulator [Galactobacter valiniphilus]RII43308.1 GntR family transcriptional regulator [Galactobacter valiniphilus]
MFDESRPIFFQIAEQVEEQVLDGTLPEGARAPSSNELASFHRINPATAAKGLNLLVDAGILHKQRGIGMFVSAGAQEQLRHRRREDFAATYLTPVLAEAARLGITREQLAQMLLSTQEEA